MTGRSIFFGRVCSLRLFPLFPFPCFAVQNNGPTFSRPAEKIFLSVAKKLTRPARIHGAAAGISTVMEGSIAKNYLVEFIRIYFVTPWSKPDIESGAV